MVNGRTASGRARTSTLRSSRFSELLQKYRDLQIPIDNIVQDWFWWTKTGEFKFNQNYPDPKAMIDRAARGALPFDDVGLALFRSRLGNLCGHG